MPNSSKVGTSGNAAMRFLLATGTGVTLPAASSVLPDARVDRCPRASPAATSINAGAEPRYGIRLNRTAALAASASPRPDG